MKRYLATALVSGLGLAAAPAAADEAGCEALNDMPLSNGFVTSARVVDANEDLPAYCEVRAQARPAIAIEVRLPMEEWNGKLYQAGCGGFCGILGRADASPGWVNAMRPGLQRGYATATSDSGHFGLSVLDAEWADENPAAERDWGWRQIGATNEVAQELITAYYGNGSSQSVFQGCSTGGRLAHVAAQRYPDMFDGIISGAPAMDYPGLVATNFAWLVQANTDANGEAILKPGKDKLIGDAVMAQCDGLDGKADGLISNPLDCHADLSSLTCTGDAGPDCLSQAEQDVIEKWRQPPTNAAGEVLYPGGILPGSEPFWWLWLTGNGKGGGKLIPLFGNSFGAYMAFDHDPGVGWTLLDFDLEKDPARMAHAAGVYNGDNPDLSAFRRAGGKMIVWHGWADSIVPPGKTLDWYAKASEAAGDEETLKENVALFMIPGVDHCGILPGPGGISQANLDPLTPLEAWMNEGIAPQGIMAGK